MSLLPAEQHVSPQRLLGWINIPNLEFHDMEKIDERRQVWVPAEEQASAEHLLQARQFREWLVSPKSTQLLIHGNYDSKRLVSGLSLFCTSFVRALQERAPRFIHLIFFCGLHVDSDVDSYVGARAMIQTFICQLLCQFDFGSAMPSSAVSRELVQSGDVEALCGVFLTLVHRLPRSIALICIIDGIVYYERPEFCDDLGVVLAAILRLSGEQSTQAAVKVLVASPIKTNEVRLPFPDELILSMDAIARPGWVASRTRVERQLREGFQDEAGPQEELGAGDS